MTMNRRDGARHPRGDRFRTGAGIGFVDLESGLSAVLYEHQARAIFFNRNEGFRDGTYRGYRPAVSRIENDRRARWRRAIDELSPLPPWQRLWRTKRKIYERS